MPTHYNSRTSRRSFLSAVGAGAAAALAGCTGSATGDNYPSEPIELVIPYGTAGGYNAYTRLVGPYLGEALGASEVVYNNIVGAGGRVAIREVYNADPDGYTMMLMNGDNAARQHVIYDLDYDVREMTYFPQVTQEATLFGVAPDAGVETWDDWVSATNADELRFGSESPSSSGVVAPVMAGVNSGDYDPMKVVDNFVQYPTKNEMVAGIRRGNINVMASSYSSVLPFVESGDVVPFLVTTADETPPDPTPEAKTLATEGVSNAEQIESATKGIRVFTGPPGIDDDLKSTIEDGYMAAFEDEELRADAAEINRPIRSASGEEARTAIEQKIDSNERIADLLRQLSGEE